MRDEKIQKILNLGIAFSKERSKEKLLDRILEAAMDLTSCDGGKKPWITPEEYDQLLIQKGTLTGADRQIMNQHVVMTKQMNLEGSYGKILLWASQHHERLDGSGCLKCLKGGKLKTILEANSRREGRIPARPRALMVRNGYLFFGDAFNGDVCRIKLK